MDTNEDIDGETFNLRIMHKEQRENGGALSQMTTLKTASNTNGPTKIAPQAENLSATYHSNRIAN